jgi:hypothetical protein
VSAIDAIARANGLASSVVNTLWAKSVRGAGDLARSSTAPSEPQQASSSARHSVVVRVSSRAPVVVGCLAAAVSLSGAPIAQASPLEEILLVSWSAPVDVSRAGQVGRDQLLVSKDGTRAMALWSRTLGTDSVIETASATISGNRTDWGPATNLGWPGLGDDARSLLVRLSADGTRATALWEAACGGADSSCVESSSATIAGDRVD